MFTKEELQGHIGPLWEVTEVYTQAFELVLPELTPELRPRLLGEIEKVRDVAYRFQEEQGVPLVDAIWHAASVLLGPSKYSALERMYGGDAADTLSEVYVAQAILGGVEATEEGASFVITEALLESIGALSEVEMEKAERAVLPVPGEEGVIWYVSKALGWAELLPQAFELRKLGPWETDSMYLERCLAVLGKLTTLFPPPPPSTEILIGH